MHKLYFIGKSVKMNNLYAHLHTLTTIAIMSITIGMTLISSLILSYKNTQLLLHQNSEVSRKSINCKRILITIDNTFNWVL